MFCRRRDIIVWKSAWVTSAQIVEPTSSLAWADVIHADFEKVISRGLQNISTYLFCTAERMLRNIIVQNFRLIQACFPIQVDEVWIDRFCIRYDWWRRLQPTSSVSPVWILHLLIKLKITATKIHMKSVQWFVWHMGRDQERAADACSCVRLWYSLQLSAWTGIWVWHMIYSLSDISVICRQLRLSEKGVHAIIRTQKGTCFGQNSMLYTTILKKKVSMFDRHPPKKYMLQLIVNYRSVNWT